jgi:hypothetical protein
MIRVKKINSEVVKPVRFLDEEKDKRPVKGRDIFPEIYGNIFFCARKKSGKTCAIYHIIDKCSTRETKVIAFVSTLHRDPTWRAIRKMCEKRGIEFTGFTSIKDESSKEDILQNIVDALTTQTGKGKDGESEEEEEEEAPPPILLMGDRQVGGKAKKPKKPKEKAPKIIFVIDDLSGEISTPSVAHLLKMHRHIKCKVLLSSQYWNDITLQGRKQIDYVLLFRGLAQSTNKMEEIYKNCDLSIPFNLFLDLYKYCTKDPYNFMYIDTNSSLFRKNFTHQIELDED